MNFKRKAVDSYLAPIRSQIGEIVESGSSVVELGSGWGSQLLQLSPKIKHGIGFDSNQKYVKFAQHKALQQGISNITFKKALITPTTSLPTADVYLFSCTYCQWMKLNPS